MSLGYALLHSNRIQIALDAGPRKRTYDDLSDFAFGILGTSAGDLGAGVIDFAQSRMQWFNDIVEQQIERFTGENGPFSFIQDLLDRIGNIEGVADLINEFFAVLGNTNGISLRDSLHQWVEKLCETIPDLSGEALNQFLMEQVSGITAVLEQPLLSGRRDVTAHRAFRAAVTLRQYISEGLDEAPWASAEVDLKSILCQMLHQVIAGADDTAISGFVEFLQSFQGEYGRLLSASLSFGASVSVSTGEGPQGMPGEDPSYLDEVKAVSHTSPGGMWGLDLATNILATFFLVWESVRTGNYEGRWFDATLSVLTILWHAFGHTMVRAAWPDSINRARDDDSAGNIFKNWFFTDQGNFSLNILIRLFQSFHDGGGSNWALSFAQRLLKYFSNVTIIRSFYYFTRSVWYFKDRAAVDNPQPVSMVRMFWAVWGPMSWIAAFFSFFLSWDDFSLEKGFTARTIVLLVLGLGLGFIVGYIVLWILADQRPGSLQIAPDWWTLVLTVVCSILGLIALIIILADLESESRGGAIAGAVVIGVLTLLGIGLPALFHFRTEEHHIAWEILIEVGMFLLLFSGALLVAGVLPFFLWWFFIDDGRDKHSLFEGKDADTSPYKLPYPSGENWLCGQGVHGIFSHIPTDLGNTDSIDNEYAYDFNEKENKHALAARDGIVLEVIRDNENGSDNQNSIDVMHTSWHPGHDPGTDNERVLTYSVYVHLSRNRVWVDVGHRFVQGVHLADIDSTGRSAQHHLHFHAEEYQRRVLITSNNEAGRRNVTIPVVFKDSSTHRFRNFPFLAWIPGKGHVDGKPLSMAFYTSDNEEKESLVNPVALSLDEQGAPAHEHWILLDRTNITSDPLPASLTVRTSVNANHYHEITLTREQLLNIMRVGELSGLTVSQINGHQHTVIGYKYQQAVMWINLSNSSSAGIANHGHGFEIRQRDLGLEWGTLPPSITIPTWTALSGTPSAHAHDVTLTHQQLFDLLRRQQLPTGISTNVVSGHDHDLLAIPRRGTAEPGMDIVEPPRAQLLAENPGPYNLVGDQMVVRVNERATEYFFYGVHRPRLRGEIALDRGLGNSHIINIGGHNHTPNTTDITVQGSLSSFNTVLAARPVQARVEPVIVVETVQRGSGASILVDAGSSAVLQSVGEGRGSGEFAHIDQATQAQLVNHFNTYLTTGWPSAPGVIHAQVVSNRLELQLGGAAITFPDKKTRNTEVLRRLYDSANMRLRATGDMPLSSGRIDLTNSYGVPVVGTAAQVEIDTSHAAFAGTDLTATALEVTVRGRTTEITLVTGDNAASELARKIALNIEGVRAWESSTNRVKVQTIAVGSGIGLEIRKRLAAGYFHQQNSGDAPNLTISTAGCNFSGAISDSNALAPNQCCAIIHSAIANATLPYDSGVVIDSIQMDGNQLVIRVNSGHTINATAVKFSGGTDPFGFTQNGPEEIRSTNLAGNVDLNGPGWVELTIDGDVVIIPFDAEPARVDLVLAERLPTSGENLTLNINGSGNSTLAFTGNEGSVGAIAAAIAQHFNNVSVRLAYRISFENALYGQPSHNLQLNDAQGLAMAGFLDDRSTYTTAAVSAADADQMATPNSLSAPVPDPGVPVHTFTLSESTPGSDITFEINVQADYTVNMSPTPTPDPLNIGGSGTNTLTTAAIPPELRLPSQCQQYQLDVLDGSGDIVATSRLQIAASPAMVRTQADFSATLPSNTVLPITVVEPDTSSTTVDRVFSVELSGVSSLADVVHSLNAQVPAIRAWIATPGGNQRLHIESRGYGYGWKLRLGNPNLLLALGFTESQVDLDAQQLEVEGRGDVRNGAKMTQDEVRSALQRIDQCATQTLYTTTNTPRSLLIERSGSSDLVLSSVEGPVTIETEPASIKQALNVVESGGTATISPGAAYIALDCGIINVKAAGRSVAAVRLFADHATVTAAEPLATAGSAAETQQLNHLKARAIIVKVGGLSQPVGPLPASTASLTDAVAWYAQNLPAQVWIGIDAANHVVLQSRRRGNASLILEIDFTNFMTDTFAPGDTLLGFVVAPATGGNVWQFTGQGFGNVTDMNAVPVWSIAPASIEAYLSTSAQQGASRQAIYDVEVDASAGPTDLRIRSQVAARTLSHPVPPATNPVPGGIQFSVAGGGVSGALLETNFSLTPPVQPGELALEVAEPGVVGTRSVVALIAGAPARLIPLIFPTNISILNGKGFDIVLNSTAGPVTYNVQFSGVSTQQQVTAQVERQCQWKVRANIISGAMIIETIGAGSAYALGLNSSSVTTDAVTTNINTGLIAGSVSAPQSLPLTGRGGGSVPDMDNIEAEHYKNALLDGYIMEASVTNTTNRTSRQVDLRVYKFPRDTSLDYFTLASQRNGCMSSLEPIVYIMKGLVLNRDMERAPAIHGSVLLPLPELSTLDSDTLNLATDAVLSIELNNNGNIEDLPARSVVEVSFSAGDYTARDVARRIHEELFSRGAGQAAAYPDGQVVVETALMARDYVGDGDGGEVDDLGWIRTPAFANSLPAAFDAQKGSPAWNLTLPLGRYLMAVRADAAKTRDYHASGEMVISGNTHPDESQRHFVHQVRYWIQFANAQILGIGKLERDEAGINVTYYVPDLLYMG